MAQGSSGLMVSVSGIRGRDLLADGFILLEFRASFISAAGRKENLTDCIA